MASITVKNIPDELLERLRQAAEDSNRSINRQIIECLERQLQPRAIDVDAAIERARKIRGEGPAHVSLGDLSEARRQGRP